MAEARVALVYGATGAVGTAICRTLASQGLAVAVHCRDNVTTAAALVGDLRLSVPAAVVAGDLTSPDESDEIVRSAAEQLGSVPVVAVNAAYPRTHSRYLADTTAAEVDAHLAGFAMYTNLCRSVIPGMRAASWGRIVLVSGALAARYFPGLTLMSAVKAGMTSLSRALALEEGRHGITVNVVSPGRLEFDGGDAAFEPDPAYEQLDEVTKLRVALRDVPGPADVASMVAFLATPQAHAITGQVIYVAGGEPL